MTKVIPLNSPNLVGNEMRYLKKIALILIGYQHLENILNPLKVKFVILLVQSIRGSLHKWDICTSGFSKTGWC